MIERKKINLDTEKNIIIGMIVSDTFLRDIRIYLKDLTFLKTEYHRIIADWCIQHYSVYSVSPKELIHNIYDNKKDGIRNEDVKDNVITTLQSLSKKYIENKNTFNYDYHFDNARLYLREKSIESHIKNLQSDLLSKDINKAENRISTYSRLEKPTGAGIDLLNDTSHVIDAFSDENMEGLIKFRGDLGESFKQFHRGDLISFGAPQKRGKTHALTWFGTVAMRQGLKVCHFTLEMKTKLMTKRIFPGLLGETKYKNQEINIPYFDEDDCIMHKTKVKQGIDVSKVLQYQEKLKKITRGGGYRLFDMSDADTVEKIEICLENLEHFDDFLCDVLIVDYPDILRAERNSPKDYRNQLDYTWKSLRWLADKRNILIVGATQMSKDMLDKDGSEKNISEDIRKYSHVSHFITLNQNKKEQDLGIMRFRTTGRHDEFRNEDVIVLNCLQIGRFVLDSRWKHKVSNYNDLIFSEKKENKAKRF